MSARNSVFSGAEARSESKAIADRRIERGAQAQRGIQLQTVREGSPAAVASLLECLEADGDVAIQDFSDSNALMDEVMLEEVAPETNLDDEDEFPSADLEEIGETDVTDAIVLGEDHTPLPPEPLSGDSFRLVVLGDSCTFAKPAWAGCYSARTAAGQQVLYEVSVRLNLLNHLARWLQGHRRSFLRSKELWDLGPQDRTEMLSGGVSVLQKGMLAIKNVQPPVSEASFSRFIRAAALSWEDGTAPLSVLFSDAARLAWVAKSVWMFAGGSLTNAMLRKTAQVKVRKGKATRTGRRAIRIGGMDFQSFIEHANRKAGTKWTDVLDLYQTRMVIPHGNEGG